MTIDKLLEDQRWGDQLRLAHKKLLLQEFSDGFQIPRSEVLAFLVTQLEKKAAKETQARRKGGREVR